MMRSSRAVTRTTTQPAPTQFLQCSKSHELCKGIREQGLSEAWNTTRTGDAANHLDAGGLEWTPSHNKWNYMSEIRESEKECTEICFTRLKGFSKSRLFPSFFLSPFLLCFGQNNQQQKNTTFLTFYILEPEISLRLLERQNYFSDF
jgi:hypothetical protein